MPSKLFFAALAALAMPLANAGPCAVSTPTTTPTTTPAPTTSSTTTTSTSDLSTTSTTTTTTTTTSVAPTCTAYNPAPSDLHCGGQGSPSGVTIVDTIYDIDLDDCALTCYESSSCLSFAYGDGVCDLYAQAGTLLRRAPTITVTVAAVPPWYELECFDCGGPTSTSTATTATTTTTTSTTIQSTLLPSED